MLQKITSNVIIPVFLFLLSVQLINAQVQEGYIHPGIDIAPSSEERNVNYVYTTHSGFVTYAGPAPTYVAEKGWMVQVETDLNRDNVPDIITRYNHLFEDTLLINDFKYKRINYTPECFMDLSTCLGGAESAIEKLPYGYGPYVARNQMLGRMGDSGSPGHQHVQYEIVTNRYIDTFGLTLNKYSCQDDPYFEACGEDPSRPGFFFPINRQKSRSVRGPVYINPGSTTPIPAPTPIVVADVDSSDDELPEDPPPPEDVPPIPTGPVSGGSGDASGWPGIEPALADRGDIIFFEGYEDDDWAAKYGVHCNVPENCLGARTSRQNEVFDGGYSMEHSFSNVQLQDRGENKDSRYYHFGQGYSELFMRWYVKIEDGDYFDPDYQISWKGPSLAGWDIRYDWYDHIASYLRDNCQARTDDCYLPEVTDIVPKFSLRGSIDHSHLGNPHIYRYRGGPQGTGVWIGRGNKDNNILRYQIQPDTWTCVEVQLAPNTIGQEDGILRMWVDEQLVSNWTQEKLRTIEQQQIQGIDFFYHLYVHDGPVPASGTLLEDNIVVAENRIGCSVLN